MPGFRTAVLTAIIPLALACQSAGTSFPAPDAAPAASESRLESTPRHDEWVDIEHDGRTVRAYVVYPQRSTRGPAVLVIHENRGLTDWVRTVADELAENGYIAVAPDLLTGSAPNGGGTKDFPTEDAAREAISKLPREQVTADLRAVADYAKKIPSANGRLAVGGFCWGGSQTWNVATNIGGVDAAFVFYGTGPQAADSYARVTAPVYGFYGGNDERVNATIPTTADAMRAAGKTYEPVTYPGAGHAFMRLGEMKDADPANATARNEGWKRWLELLNKTFGS